MPHRLDFGSWASSSSSFHGIKPVSLPCPQLFKHFICEAVLHSSSPAIWAPKAYRLEHRFQFIQTSQVLTEHLHVTGVVWAAEEQWSKDISLSSRPLTTLRNSSTTMVVTPSTVLTFELGWVIRKGLGEVLRFKWNPRWIRSCLGKVGRKRTSRLRGHLCDKHRAGRAHQGTQRRPMLGVHSTGRQRAQKSHWEIQVPDSVDSWEGITDF